MPERLHRVQRPQKAAGRAEAAARLSARQRGRTCPGTATAGPIDLPRAEGAAAAFDQSRAQLPTWTREAREDYKKSCFFD